MIASDFEKAGKIVLLKIGWKNVFSLREGWKRNFQRHKNV